MLDAERILGTLVDHEVRFVIVGALAATLHGSPLRTEDVDICPEPSLDNLERLGRALKALHAQEWDPHKGEFVDREWTSETLSVDLVWILGTSSGRLDLVFAPAGFDGFEHLAKNAIEQDIDGLRVTVASLEDVIRSKEQLNREKDRAQLPTLRRLLESIDERVGSSDSGT